MTEPVVKPINVAFVGAIVDDPVGAAQHLGEVFDIDVSILAVDGPTSLPRATVALGDCVLALYPKRGKIGIGKLAVDCHGCGGAFI